MSFEIFNTILFPSFLLVPKHDNPPPDPYLSVHSTSTKSHNPSCDPRHLHTKSTFNCKTFNFIINAKPPVLTFLKFYKLLVRKILKQTQFHLYNFHFNTYLKVFNFFCLSYSWIKNEIECPITLDSGVTLIQRAIK